MLGSEEGLYSLALSVLRLLDIATNDSNGPSDEDTCSDTEILSDKFVKEDETVACVHPPLPRHPHDKAISTFCAILFVTTVLLLYFFPPPS